MKWGVLFFLSLTGQLLAQSPRVPEIPYQSVPGFLKLPPDTYLGEVAGVAVNSKGHVFVLSRGNSTGPAYGASAAQLLEFDAGGKFLREIGHNLYAWSFAHSVKVDKEDNIWVADKGSDMVIKFTPEGPSGHGLWAQAGSLGRGNRAVEASQTTTASGGWNVSPGYRYGLGLGRQHLHQRWLYQFARLRRSTRNGNWIKSWGEPGSQPGQFNMPHSIAVDAEDHVYVADRGNRRIQVFDGDGKFLRQIVIDVPVDPNARPAIGNKPELPIAGTQTMAPGAPWAICITPPPHQVLYSSDGYPGPDLQDQSGRRSPGCNGRIRQATQAVWLDSRDRVPVRKCALHW